METNGFHKPLWKKYGWVLDWYCVCFFFWAEKNYWYNLEPETSTEKSYGLKLDPPPTGTSTI